MRGYAKIFRNRKTGEFTIQPTARGPIGISDFGISILMPQEQFTQQILSVVVENILKYHRQVYDDTRAISYSSQKQIDFLKNHTAVSLTWDETGELTIRPLRREKGGMVSIDGQEIVLNEDEISTDL